MKEREQNIKYLIHPITENYSAFQFLQKHTSYLIFNAQSTVKVTAR